MPFEKHESTGRGRSTTTEPKISLRKSGSIGINSAALDEYFEDKHGAVMYFDSDEGQVGIRRLDSPDDDDAAYTISRSNGSAAITPGSFLEANDLIPEVTKQYQPRTEDLNDDVELVVFDLEDDLIGTYGNTDDQEDDNEEQ